MSVIRCPLFNFLVQLGSSEGVNNWIEIKNGDRVKFSSRQYFFYLGFEPTTFRVGATSQPSMHCATHIDIILDPNDIYFDWHL